MYLESAEARASEFHSEYLGGERELYSEYILVGRFVSLMYSEVFYFADLDIRQVRKILPWEITCKQ